MPRRLIWLPMLALLLSGTGTPVAAAAAAAVGNRVAAAGAPVGTRASAPRALVLVLRATWPEVLPVLAADGRPVAAGLVTTLPGAAPPADRVLSVATGEAVDAAGLWPAPTPAAVGRLHREHPGTAAVRIPVAVLAGPGAEVAGVFGLGFGAATAAEQPLPADGDVSPPRGRLLVVGVADARQLGALLPRLSVAGPVLVAGLEAGPGRARTAPIAELGATTGVLTSSSTRRRGLVAWADIRPTLASGAEDIGSPIEIHAAQDPLQAVTRVDGQVGALVAARGPAQVLAPAIAVAAFALVLAVIFLRRERLRRPARAAVVGVLTLPAGFLLASVLAPQSALLWLALGPAAAAVVWVLSLAAGPRAPAVAAGALLSLVALDLVSGSPGLSRPLLGGSAFDGERFYGMGNGYFADALAAAVVIVTSRRLGRGAALTLVVALAAVVGLPSLGADVGGVASCAVTAVAVWVLLGPKRPSARAVGAALAVAALTGLLIVAGAGLGGSATHGTRFLHDLGGGRLTEVMAVVRHRLGTNGRLLATNPWAWYGPIQVVVLAVLLVRPVAWLPILDRRVRSAMLAGVIGMAVLTVANDTGVTAAAGGGLSLLMLYCLVSLDAGAAKAASGRPAKASPSRTSTDTPA